MTWKDYKIVGRDVLKDVESVSISYFDNGMISFGIKLGNGFIETYDLTAKDNQLEIQRGGIYCPYIPEAFNGKFFEEEE